ncbi:MAG: immunoglobulin-like domain-containing protein [Bacillota bacterium]|nr:immunoglobulin-like domain-containing protein [Bacillota bacterium]
MESGTKSRIKNILNYRIPVFWIIIAVLAVALTVGVYLLANLLFEYKSLEKSTYDSAMQNADIQITINNTIITPETQNITMILENKSDIKYIYGKFTTLEIQIDQTWYTIPTKKGVNWTMLAYSLNPHSQVEKVFDLSYFYDKLKPGEYRFIEWISTNEMSGKVSYVFTEFTVESKSADQNTDNGTISTTSSSVTSSALPWNINIQLSISGVPLFSQDINKNTEKRVIQTIVLEHTAKSSAWSGVNIDQLSDQISILISQSKGDRTYEQYVVFNDGKGIHCLLSAQDNRFSVLNEETYQRLLEIVRQVFFQKPQLMVKSGSNSIQALGHWVYSYNKIQKVSADSIYLTAQGVVAYLQYLPINFVSGAQSGTVPFTVYSGGKEIFGHYTLYDESFEEITFVEPSGLSPQTYIFHDVKPGKYIVKLETSFETLSNRTGYQYFFGVIVPERAGQ